MQQGSWRVRLLNWFTGTPSQPDAEGWGVLAPCPPPHVRTRKVSASLQCDTKVHPDIVHVLGGHASEAGVRGHASEAHASEAHATEAGEKGGMHLRPGGGGWRVSCQGKHALVS